MPAAKTPAGGKVSVRLRLDATHGDHGHFIAGREYEVDKATAAWLLEDERVAVPVKASSAKTETATVEE